MKLLFGLGLPEIIVIAVIVLILFGGKKIPELMRGLGKGVKEFKDGLNGADAEKEESPAADEAVEDKDKSAAASEKTAEKGK